MPAAVGARARGPARRLRSVHADAQPHHFLLAPFQSQLGEEDGFARHYLGGYTTYGARDGREALELVERADTPVDLVIADWGLPELGGGELAERLGQLRRGLPVLLTSGYSVPPEECDVGRTGDLFLPKPFTPEQLVARVAALLAW